MDPFRDRGALKKKKKKASVLLGRGIPPPTPSEKIRHIKAAALELGDNDLASAFDEIHFPEIRNAIAHADYTLTDEDLRLRKWWYHDPIRNVRTPIVPLDQLNDIIARAFGFYSALFQLHIEARAAYRGLRGRCFPFDPN